MKKTYRNISLPYIENFLVLLDIFPVTLPSYKALYQEFQIGQIASVFAPAFFYNYRLATCFLFYNREMKDLTDVKLYYINLNTRKDRKDTFEAQQALAAMPPIERVSAVHGLSLDILNDKRIGLHTRVQVTTEFRRSHYEIHSRGAVGASFSHIKTWKAFLANGAKYALIMEDDVKLPPTFAMMVRHCMKDLPAKWDIWIMGWNHTPSDLNTKGSLAHIREILHFTGAHCYLLTREAAKILVREAFPIESHIEHFMSNTAFIHRLKIIRDVRLHMPQMDRVLTVSDVRKPEGCPACVVDDKKQAIAARIANAL